MLLFLIAIAGFVFLGRAAFLKKSRGRNVLIGLLLIAPLSYNILYEKYVMGNYDFNPVIADKGTLVGEWVYKDIILVLKENGSYSYTGEIKGYTANQTHTMNNHWDLDGWNLTLYSPDGASILSLRVLWNKDKKRYRLLKDIPKDWDACCDNFGFYKRN